MSKIGFEITFPYSPCPVWKLIDQRSHCDSLSSMTKALRFTTTSTGVFDSNIFIDDRKNKKTRRSVASQTIKLPARTLEVSKYENKSVPRSRSLKSLTGSYLSIPKTNRTQALKGFSRISWQSALQ